MGREHFLSEFVLFDHEFEVDVDHFAALGVDDLLLLLLPLGLLHFEPPLLPVFFYLLDFLQMPAGLLVAGLHI